MVCSGEPRPGYVRRPETLSYGSSMSKLSPRGRASRGVQSVFAGCLAVTVSLLVALLPVVAGPAVAAPRLQVPFEAGVPWYVCQGYNGAPSHNGNLRHGLDLTVETARGPNGCWGNANASSGRLVTSPAAGTARALAGGGAGSYVCVSFDSGGSMAFMHLNAGGRASGRVGTGDRIGTVAPAGQSDNGGYAHAHLNAYPASGCVGDRVPLTGSFQLAGAPDLPNTGAPNQHAGARFLRSSAPQPPSGQNPVGHIDEVASPANGKVKVRGWTFDRDAVSQSIAVHAYIGGRAGAPGVEGHALTANVSRPDVDRTHRVGAFHGFDSVVSTRKIGRQDVCLYAINAGPGSNVELGCRTTTIGDPRPVGTLDEVKPYVGKLVRVRGWSFDPDQRSTQLTMHVYVGPQPGQPGATASVIKASKYRPDVNRAHGVGDRHGFDSVVRVKNKGPQRACVYAINVGNGNENRQIGCRTVTVR